MEIAYVVLLEEAKGMCKRIRVEFLPFLEITRELVGKVLFLAIRPQPLDFSTGFPFGKAFHLQEARENFAFLLQVKHYVV